MTTAAAVLGLAAWFVFFVGSTCGHRGHDWSPYTLICRRCFKTREEEFSEQRH